MDIKLFITGVIFVIIGFLMFKVVRKEQPASDENNWEGPLPEQHTKGRIISIFMIFAGLALIFKSL